MGTELASCETRAVSVRGAYSYERSCAHMQCVTMSWQDAFMPTSHPSSDGNSGSGKKVG